MDENHDEILEGVKAILSRYTTNQQAKNNMTPSSRLIQDLHINSARVIDIVLELEDKFNVQIADSAIESIGTVGGAVALIENLRK